MSSKRVLITSRHDLTERMLLFDEHFDERVKLAFELDSNVFLYYYNGTTKISEFGGLSDGEKLSFSTEDIPDGVYTDIENAVKNGRAKRVNADDKRKFKQLEQTANSLYSNQQSEPSPQIIKSPKGRVGRQQKPLDITGAPGYEKLGEEEKTLCTALRLTPQLYLDIKTVLTTECSKQGYLKKQQARSLIKIDVNKTAAIFDFLQEQGWINNNASMIQTAQTHHQIQQHHAQHALHNNNNNNDLNAYQAGYLQSIQQQQQGGGYLQQEANYMISQTTSNSNANNSSNLNLTQAHELIQNGVQGMQGISQAHSMQSQQQRLSLLPNQQQQQQQQQQIMVPKFKQEHPNLVQQPPTKKVKRENPIIPQNTNSSSSIQTPHSSIPNKAIHSSNNGQTQQNVVYERVYFSYQTKGNAPPPPHQHPVFYAIPTQTPQHTSSHLQQTTHHHIQQTNSHIVGGAHANNQHSHQTTHHTQQQQFSSTYTTPQSDDNIQHPPQDSSSGEEPVLDLWDPAALQQTNQDQDHWGSVLDVQARDSMNMPAFNPNYPQANLQYTQYVPDDVANLPFPTSHQ